MEKQFLQIIVTASLGKRDEQTVRWRNLPVCTSGNYDIEEAIYIYESFYSYFLHSMYKITNNHKVW